MRNPLLLLILLVLAGCQSQVMLMPTPEVLKDDRFNLFAANPEPLTSNEIRTLYVTTRVPKEKGSNFFSAGVDERLHFGYADLRIGKENLNLFELIDQSTTGERKAKFGWELLNAPILSATERPTDQQADGRQLPAEMQAFMTALNNYIESKSIRELTIYAHGANNTFYRSLAQGAQYQYFTGDNAMVLTFAWPSPGNIWQYGKDKRRADKAATDLAYLIELLAHHSSATRINLLAYSAGGRVIGGALAQLASRYSDRESLRIGQVYLTQSDQPLEEFVKALPKIFPIVDGLTVTAAIGDPVLAMASFTDFKPRLGAGGGDDAQLDISDEEWQRVFDIVNSDRMVYIDLKNVPAKEYQFSHGAWYDSSWVSTDVMVTLMGGYSAVDRGLVPVETDGIDVWMFPEDYIERVSNNILTRAEEDRKVELEAQ